LILFLLVVHFLLISYAVNSSPLHFTSLTTVGLVHTVKSLYGIIWSFAFIFAVFYTVSRLTRRTSS